MDTVNSQTEKMSGAEMVQKRCRNILRRAGLIFAHKDYFLGFTKLRLIPCWFTFLKTQFLAPSISDWVGADFILLNPLASSFANGQLTAADSVILFFAHRRIQQLGCHERGNVLATSD